MEVEFQWEAQCRSHGTQDKSLVRSLQDFGSGRVNAECVSRGVAVSLRRTAGCFVARHFKRLCCLSCGRLGMCSMCVQAMDLITVDDSAPL